MGNYFKKLNRWCLYSVVVLIIFSFDSEIDKAITIQDLRCEYNTNPLGIETSEPRLSWVLESNERGEKQTAYRVLVASSLQKLQSNAGDFWDTWNFDRAPWRGNPTPVYMPGENITEGGLPAAEVEGVNLLPYENGKSVFKIESGNYNFSINI
jgi:hypothetical protein